MNDPRGGNGSASDAGFAEAAVALARVAENRATVYRALAVGFYEPDRELLESLTSGGFTRGIGEAIAWLGPDAARYGDGLRAVEQAAEDLRGQETSAALSTLVVEYGRLFTGPGFPVVIPYESAWTDPEGGLQGKLNGPSAAQVAKAYRRHGIEGASGHRELPDHAAVELEFLYELCRRETDQWRAGDLEAARDLRRDTDVFLRAHPARWFGEFAAAVHRQSRHVLYHGLADLLTAHLVVDLGEDFDQARLPWASAPR